MSRLRLKHWCSMFGFNKNRQVSYIDTHNAAVIRYRRACKAFIWVGVVNFVGLIIGIIQYYAQGSGEVIPFYYCFGICDFFFTWLASTTMPAVWFWLFVAFLTTATTAGAVLLGVFSSQGKKIILFSMIGVYSLDWIFVFLAFFLAGETEIGLMINAGIHVVASFFLIMAVYQYYNVLNIEKRFKNIPTVAEQKEREEREREEKENDTQS